MGKIGFVFITYFDRKCLYFFTGIPPENRLLLTDDTLDSIFPEFKGGEISMLTKETKEVTKAIELQFSKEDPDRLNEAIAHCGLSIPAIQAYLHGHRGEP